MADIFGIRKIKLPKNTVLSGTARIKPEFSVKLDKANLKKIESNINAALDESLKKMASDLESKLISAINASVWPSEDGIGDIVDTGELRSSGRIEVQDNRLSIIYTVPYAALVHFGGYIAPYGNTGVSKVFIRPRPWIESALNGGFGFPEYDPRPLYTETLKKFFG